jgi:hypothetical protein
MNAVVKTYDEIEDLSIAAFGTAEGIVALAKANDQGLDAVLQSGQVLLISEFVPVVPSVLKEVYVPKIKPTKKRSITFQNLTDFSIQEYGSAEALVVLCKLNGLSLDAVIEPGRELEAGEPIKISVKNYLSERLKTINTGSDSTDVAVNGIITDDGFYIVTDSGQVIIP